jgi:segregation and condensation protein A
VAPVRASVVEAVAELMDELPRVGRITFRDLTSAFVEKLEIVVRFLAVLELFKQGHVDVAQAKNFGDIDIIWLGTSHMGAPDLELVDLYEG